MISNFILHGVRPIFSSMVSFEWSKSYREECRIYKLIPSLFQMELLDGSISPAKGKEGWGYKHKGSSNSSTVAYSW